MKLHKILNTMKLRLLLGVLALGLSLPAYSQEEMDVSKLLANTKTFIFDNNKNTVKEYIYSELGSRTSCCGSDRIYLEVRIDPSGYVLEAKTLTGKNDCFKQSAIDIIKNVKWDAKNFKGPKSVYFEIKPNIECTGQENTYAEIPVTNNELLNEKGERLYAASTPSRGNQSSEPAPSSASEPEKDLTPPPSASAPEAPEEAQAVASTEQADEAATTPATPATPSSSAEPTEEPARQPATSTEPVSPVVSTTESDEELQRAKAMADSYREVQEEEISQLKEAMDQKKAEREAEIERQQQLEAERERKIAAREARRQRLMERRQQEEAQQQGGDEPFDLFAEEQPTSSSSSDDGFGDGFGQGDDDDDDEQARTPEDRLLAELERLRREQQQLEDERRRTLDQQRQAANENERYARDQLRVEEEILRIEEEIQRYREQQELDRIAEDQRRLEDQKRQREDELQRVMDEIQRLRDEADQKMAELERQEQDLQQLNQELTQREQEIEAERIQREQLQLAELKQRELEIQANSQFAAGSGEDVSALIDQAFASSDSSDRYLGLIRTVALLEAELKRLQNQIEALGGNPQSTSPTGTAGPRTPSYANNNQNTGSQTGSYSSTDPETTVPPNSGKSALEDESWRDLDYRDPNAPKDIYRSAPAPVTPTTPLVNDNDGTAQPTEGEGTLVASNDPEEQMVVEQKVPEYQEGRGYSPHPSHKDTHANVQGPEFSNLNYGSGRDAMKRFITDRLLAGGVCGIAQAFAEVTVAPNGKVVDYKVLKANSALVSALLPPILQSLEFNSTNLRFNQNSYIEFKADLNCDGDTSTDLKKVEPYVDPTEGTGTQKN